MTAAERLQQLAGATGTAAALLLAIGAGATTGEALADYSALPAATAAEHLLAERSYVAENLAAAGAFRAIRAANTPEVPGSVVVYGALKYPDAVTKLSIAADATVSLGRAQSRFSVDDPDTGLVTTPVVVRTTTSSVTKAATCGSGSAFTAGRCYATHTVSSAVGGAFPLPTTGRAYAAFGLSVPETIQNPTIEMLTALW